MWDSSKERLIDEKLEEPVEIIIVSPVEFDEGEG